MVASTQITNTETSAFILVQIFKLSNFKVLFINKKDKRYLKSTLLFKKKANFKGKLLQKL